MHSASTETQPQINKQQKFDQMLADLKGKYQEELRDISKLSDYFLTRHDNNGQLHLIWKSEADVILSIIKVEVKVIADRIFGPYATSFNYQDAATIIVAS